MAHNNDDDRSVRKLEETAATLRQALSRSPDVFPCRLQPSTDREAQGYRCRCSFQIVTSNNGDLRYAVREDGKAVTIDNFAIANWRIQQAMQELLASLRQASSCRVLVANLTSVTFVTSWNPARTCLVTLHYNASLRECADEWKLAARQVVERHGWQELTGRSKRYVLRALTTTNTGEDDLIIQDSIHLQLANGEWRVTLEKDALSKLFPIQTVEYVLSSSAFAHPNAHVMCQALTWMLNRIEGIILSSNQVEKPTLLELYCGCGAHTMALLRSGLLARIFAVEIDERLVQACRRNAQLNQCQGILEIVSQDAGFWSSTSRSTVMDAASILLVDPPKKGLDERVCRMAMDNKNLHHVFYISCGRDALVRDLHLLSPVFEVMDCVLLDLFPQTYSVESLVHLRRRRRSR